MIITAHLLNLVVFPAVLSLLLIYLSRMLRVRLNHLHPKVYWLTVGPGIMLHELAHLITAICFGMKINDVVFWNGSKRNGHGYVNFSYRPDSLFAKFGLFFVGLAPLLIAILVSYTLITFVLDARVSPALLNVLNPGQMIEDVANSLVQVAISLSHRSPLLVFVTVLLTSLYLPHMLPSRQDLITSSKGIVPFVALGAIGFMLAHTLGSVDALLFGLYLILFWVVISSCLIVVLSVSLLLLLELINKLIKLKIKHQG